MKHYLSKKLKLPADFRPFFWSYKFSHLNLADDQELIITQLINYGDLEHWRWLVRIYGRPAVIKTLKKVPATAIKPRTRRLVSLLFLVPANQFNYAPRSTRQSR